MNEKVIKKIEQAIYDETEVSVNLSGLNPQNDMDEIGQRVITALKKAESEGRFKFNGREPQKLQEICQEAMQSVHA